MLSNNINIYNINFLSFQYIFYDNVIIENFRIIIIILNFTCVVFEVNLIRPKENNNS